MLPSSQRSSLPLPSTLVSRLTGRVHSFAALRSVSRAWRAVEVDALVDVARAAARRGSRSCRPRRRSTGWPRLVSWKSSCSFTFLNSRLSISQLLAALVEAERVELLLDAELGVKNSSMNVTSL